MRGLFATQETTRASDPEYIDHMIFTLFSFCSANRIGGMDVLEGATIERDNFVSHESMTLHHAECVGELHHGYILLLVPLAPY